MTAQTTTLDFAITYITRTVLRDAHGTLIQCFPENTSRETVRKFVRTRVLPFEEANDPRFRKLRVRVEELAVDSYSGSLIGE